MRASDIPAQAWMPVPKARWRFGSRLMSRRSGSAKLAGIAIGGADADMHIGAGWYRDAAEPRILDGAPVAELVRAFHAQEFLDRGLDRLRMLAQIAHRVGMADEKIDRIADEIGRRLVPGIEEKDAVVQELELGKPLAWRAAARQIRWRRSA